MTRGVAPWKIVVDNLMHTQEKPMFQLLKDDVVGRIIAGVAVFFATTILSFVVGRYWGRYQARKQWQRKHFLDRILVSMNSFADDILKIRTLFERSLDEIFFNPVAVEKIQYASLQTTVENPLLPIAAEDRWYLLNYVLNAVAEHFVDGLMRFDAGQPLRPVAYLLFLTCEKVGPDRIFKVRAMMIRKDHLENFPYWNTMPKLEREWHSDRIVTLRRAAELYQKEPDNFLTIEVYV